MPSAEQTGALLRRSGTHRNEFPTGYSWRVALQQSPLPLHRSISFCNRGPVLVHSFPANGRCPLPRLSHPWGEAQTTDPWAHSFRHLPRQESRRACGMTLRSLRSNDRLRFSGLFEIGLNVAPIALGRPRGSRGGRAGGRRGLARSVRKERSNRYG